MSLAISLTINIGTGGQFHDRRRFNPSRPRRLRSSRPPCRQPRRPPRPHPTVSSTGPAAASPIPIEGSGPLVVMAPGFGDLKEEYRFLAPAVVAAGYRAVTMDLRGHGHSSTGWADHSCAALGSDMLALVRHLDAGPAILIGTSMPAPPPSPGPRRKRRTASPASSSSTPSPATPCRSPGWRRRSSRL